MRVVYGGSWAWSISCKDLAGGKIMALDNGHLGCRTCRKSPRWSEFVHMVGYKMDRWLAKGNSTAACLPSAPSTAAIVLMAHARCRNYFRSSRWRGLHHQWPGKHSSGSSSRCSAVPLTKSSFLSIRKPAKRRSLTQTLKLAD